MSGDDATAPGAMRFTATGDVEIFDGTVWQPLFPLATDGKFGNRDGLLPTVGSTPDELPGPAADQ